MISSACCELQLTTEAAKHHHGFCITSDASNCGIGMKQ